MTRRGRIGVGVVAVATAIAIAILALRAGRSPARVATAENVAMQQAGARGLLKPEHERALAALRVIAAGHRRAMEMETVPAAVAAVGGIDDDERARRENEGDPVASLIPLLAGQTPEQQLAYLKWARTLPEGGYIAVFPDLVAADVPQAERAQIGRGAIDALVALLEAEGARAPDPPAGFAPVRVVDDAPPVAPPPGLLEDYRPHPDDPYRIGGK